MSALPERVRVMEVGPRDGLQNEAAPVSTADKIRFVDALTSAGLLDIEVSSFVRPDRVPQLAEGWVKRVLDGLNPFDQRVEDFHQSAVATYVSMIRQAGMPIGR